MASKVQQQHMQNPSTVSNKDRTKSILSTLDEVHRSLLYKNLEYDAFNNTEMIQNEENSFQARGTNRRYSCPLQRPPPPPPTTAAAASATATHLQLQFDSDSDGLTEETSASNTVRYHRGCGGLINQKRRHSDRGINNSIGDDWCDCNRKHNPNKNSQIRRNRRCRKSPNRTAAAKAKSVDTNSGSFSSSTEYLDCVQQQKAFKKNRSKVERRNPVKVERRLEKEEEQHQQKEQPMIQIIQQITEEQIVSSTMTINREKIRRFSGSSSGAGCTIVRSKPVNRRKCRQKVDRENVQNEILAHNNEFDQNAIEADVEPDSTVASTLTNLNSTTAPATSDQLSSAISANSSLGEMKVGRLEAGNLRTNARPVGRLMKKRLERERKKRLSSSACDDNGNKVPPVKPPRTFATGSSNRSSDDGVLSTTTVPIEELIQSTPQKTASNVGWIYETLIKNPIHPSCPTLDEINKIDYDKIEEVSYGWIDTKSSKLGNTDILNMLNYDQNSGRKCNMTSFNLPPEPQAPEIPPRQSIDTVDSCSPNKTTSKTLRQFVRDSVSSTPIRADSVDPHKFRIAVPNEQNSGSADEDEIDDDDDGDDVSPAFCKNCQDKLARKNKITFKKNAIKRTKSFFRASKRKINAGKRMLNPKNGLTDTEDFTSPAKSEATVQMNKTMDESGKKSIKHLGFTPLKSTYSRSENATTESPHKSSEFGANTEISKKTPPIKPIRKHLRRPLSAADAKQLASIGEPNFDFNRKINSPSKEKEHFRSDGAAAATVDDHPKRRFLLSPKNLFKTLKTSPSKHSAKSYRSYAEHDDDFLIFMGEYLHRIQRKIEGLPLMAQQPPETTTNDDNADTKSLNDIRKLSSNSDKSMEYMSTYRLAKDVDSYSAPEPIYTEINTNVDGAEAMQMDRTPNRYMVNNNPCAIYSLVKKSSKLSIAGTQTSEDDSVEIDFALRDGNTLSVSIEKMLDQIKSNQNDLNSNNNNNNNNGDNDINDISVYKDALDVVVGDDDNDNSPIAPPQRLEHNVLLHRPPPSIIAADYDGISQNTFFSEDICEDVLRGEAINGDIANVIHRIEKLDTSLECREFKQAVPESDDGSVATTSVQRIANEAPLDRKSVTSSYRSHQIENLSPDDDDDGIDTVDGPTVPLSPGVQKSPSQLKSLKNKLRNSFNRSTNYFRRTSTDLANATAAEMMPPDIIDPMEHVKNRLEKCPATSDYRDAYILKLNGQITFQHEIRSQLKKAIEMCRSSRTFERSPELVEAERLLLLSYRKELAANEELERLSSGDRTSIDYFEPTAADKCNATISITDLDIPLKAEAMYDTYFNYFYVCVCSYRDHVVATDTRERRGDRLKFENIRNIVFEKLDPSFRITVDIFVLRLHKNAGNIDLDGSNKSEKRSPILSPVKAFVAKTKIDSCKSKFRLQGTIQITLQSLTSTEYVENRRNQAYGENKCQVFYNSMIRSMPLVKVRPNEKTNISGESIVVGFDSEIRLVNAGLKGFLNVAVGSEKQNWSRKWATIDGCGLFMFDESDEPQRHKEPKLFIDLDKCTTRSISLADKQICAMPMTFMITIDKTKTNKRSDVNDRRPPNYVRNVERYFIATANNTDLIKWLTELNRILQFIHDWNI